MCVSRSTLEYSGLTACCTGLGAVGSGGVPGVHWRRYGRTGQEPLRRNGKSSEVRSRAHIPERWNLRVVCYVLRLNTNQFDTRTSVLRRLLGNFFFFSWLVQVVWIYYTFRARKLTLQIKTVWFILDFWQKCKRWKKKTRIIYTILSRDVLRARISRVSKNLWNNRNSNDSNL